MCGASKIALKSADADEGTTLAIGRVGIDNGLGNVGEVGGFHLPGESIEACVMCVKDGTRLTIENIGAGLQDKFGIGSSAVVQFVEREWHEGDAVTLENGKTVSLIEFADSGAVAFVGIRAAKAEADVDPVTRVAYGPAVRSHTGVLETIGEPGRFTA